MPAARRKPTTEPVEPAVAQKQYAPFRQTYMDKKAYRDPYEVARGPGYLDSPLTITKRPVTLYKVERAKGFNPTLPVYADVMYDVDHGIANESKAKGNVAPLKSASPRFAQPTTRVPGPGSYHCEKFHGAFPILFTVVTPRDAKQEQHEQKAALQHMMGVIPIQDLHASDGVSPSRPLKSALSSSKGDRKTELYAHTLQDVSVASGGDDPACRTTPLMARATVRNAYNGSYLRQAASPTLVVQRSPTSKRPPPQKPMSPKLKFKGRQHYNLQTPRRTPPSTPPTAWPPSRNNFLLT
ncbi:hypothetical protein ACHHYP_16273 [Achlya hypogyna]|uniref:Uncharacterized protein n=1 Tax=Achlya hypogyna TaxID=1202772 RepID=A0A1V9Y9F4_ACHHY|nr:hypothetical protein ACHHYP_16273 [Achlya hypogyna]